MNLSPFCSAFALLVGLVLAGPSRLPAAPPAAPVANPAVAPAGASDLLATLRPGHPRLLATAADWGNLKTRLAADSQLASVHTAILAQATSLLNAAPVERKLTGRRLLAVSRTLLGRIVVWSYAWRLTGEEKFVQRAEREMLAAAAFSDWNPSHFLDVGEATAALALGYDWCHDGLSAAARRTIRQAIISKGLEPGLSPKNTWQRTENNWNQVCFGGLTLGALAVADESPAVARQILTLAHAGIAHGLKPYAPDGVYPEGPSYWAYGTGYQVLMIAALESALGTDWNLPEAPGFLSSAGAVLQATGPSGRFYNFADGREHASFEPALFWFARQLHDPGLLTFNQRYVVDANAVKSTLRDNRALAFAALWWPAQPVRNLVPALPLAWHGAGANPIGVFRTSWTDPDSLYLAFKGGSAGLNHAHMDAGSFILERDGIRWAIDLGSQAYESLESKGVDLWNRRQESQRWQVYRLNNTSHSTLTLNDQPHRVDGSATITAFADALEDRHADLDLTPVFGSSTTRVQRRFRQLSARAVQIDDDLTGLAAGTTVRWQMPTRAKVEIRGQRVILRQDDRTLEIEARAPANVTWTAAPAAAPPDDFNAPNPGVTMLSFAATAPTAGNIRLTVVLGAENEHAPVVPSSGTP